MPIKPENKARYPKDWKLIRDRIVQRAGNKCEFCGVRNGELGGRRKEDGKFFKAYPSEERALRLEWPKPGDRGTVGDGDISFYARIIRIVLTVAHLDHTPENCADDNLKALCQRCHLKHDHKHHMRNASETRRKSKAVAELFA